MKSWRDLPILFEPMGERGAVEMRPRLFLRTAEFLWQEGHTAHETKAEAEIRNREKMLRVYETFARDYLAIPVISGEKSESERFPGAVQTCCIEAMVQDRKAIQAGTSHFLGQEFLRRLQAFSSRGATARWEHAWTTSWGVEHPADRHFDHARYGDDDGLILPPPHCSSACGDHSHHAEGRNQGGGAGSGGQAGGGAGNRSAILAIPSRSKSIAAL